ncbi:hypothetical protein FRB97_001538, partial [Tulasnella sp. 331]
SGWIGYRIYNLLKITGKLLTPAQGAYTVLFAATSADARDRREYGVAYLEPYGVLDEPSKEANDLVAANDLRQTSKKVAEAM